MLRIFLMLVRLSIIAAIVFSNVFAYELVGFKAIPNITKQEVVAISQLTEKTINIGISSDLELDSSQSFGMMVPVLEILKNVFNLKISIVKDNWDNLYKAAKEGKLDIINMITPNKERDKDGFYFSETIYSNLYSVFVLEESNITKLNELKNKRIGFLKGAVSHSILKNITNYNIEPVYFENIDMGYELLKNKGIDAFVESGFNRYDILKYPKLEVAFDVEFLKDLSGLATTKEEIKPLVSVLNKYINIIGLQKLRENIKEESSKYLINSFKKLYSEELKGVNKTLDVYMNNSYYPVSFIDKENKGKLQGIGVEVIELFSDITNAKCNIIPVNSEIKLLEKLHNNEAQIIVGEIDDGNNSCSKPLYTSQFVLISNSDTKEYKNIEEVNQIRIGVPKVFNNFARDISENIISYNDTNKCFENLRKKNVELVLSYKDAADYYNATTTDNSIRINKKINGDYNMCLITDRDNPKLGDMLNDVIRLYKINTPEYKTKWDYIIVRGQQEYEKALEQRNNTIILLGLVFFALIALTVILVWVYKRRMHNLSEDNDKLHLISLTDALTKVANRRGIEQYLEKYWLLCFNDKAPISMLMIDVDYFKNFNDNYGHDAGDKCLVHIVNLIKRSIHVKEYIIGRFGGDEFVVILPYADSIQAQKIAKEIIINVRNSDIKHEFSFAAKYQTVSIGVASIIPDSTNKPLDLYRRSDKALYVSKEKGRDRVNIFGEDTKIDIM